MKRQVNLIDKKDVFQQYFFKIEEATLQHELPNGQMSSQMTRLSFVRGDSVAALVHNAHDDTFIFTYQFRYPTYHHGAGWLHELPAGALPEGKDPADHMREELLEEIGYHCEALHHIKTFYVSPGGTSERIILYYAKVTAKDQKSDGGGIAEEDEYIERVTIKTDAALKWLDDGAVTDAKTIIALQWFKLQQPKPTVLGWLWRAIRPSE